MDAQITLPAHVQALLFDLDGTLIDTARANARAYALALAEAGIRADTEHLMARIQGKAWSQFLPPLIEASGVSADPVAVARRKSQIYIEGMACLRLNEPLLALLAACRGRYRTGLVTSASAVSVNALFDSHSLRKLFDTVVTGDDVAAHKPQPQPYLLAAERLMLAPQACLAFEDSDIGVQSARSAGMAVFRVSFPPPAAQAPPFVATL